MIVSTEEKCRFRNSYEQVQCSTARVNNEIDHIDDDVWLGLLVFDLFALRSQTQKERKDSGQHDDS